MDLIDYLLHAEQEEEEEEQLQRQRQRQQQQDDDAIDRSRSSTTRNVTSSITITHDNARQPPPEEKPPYENLKLAICHRTMFNGNIPLNFDRIKGMDIIS